MFIYIYLSKSQIYQSNWNWTVWFPGLPWTGRSQQTLTILKNAPFIMPSRSFSKHDYVILCLHVCCLNTSTIHFWILYSLYSLNIFLNSCFLSFLSHKTSTQLRSNAKPLPSAPNIHLVRGHHQCSLQDRDVQRDAPAEGKQQNVMYIMYGWY